MHPKTVDAAATSVLYAAEGIPPYVDVGSPLTIWGTYRNQDDPTERVGGLAQVTTLVENTDYDGNTAADGSGSDVSSDLSISATAWGTTVKLVVTNNGSQRIHLVTSGGVTLLQMRGKRVRDVGPQTSEVSSGNADRSLNIDMKYQDLIYIGLSAAQYLAAQQASLASQVDEMEFIANVSDAFMTQALAREPGDRITVTEPVTGLALVDAVIHRVTLQVTDGPWLRCIWGLAPASPWNFFQWGLCWER